MVYICNIRIAPHTIGFLYTCAFILFFHVRCLVKTHLSIISVVCNRVGSSNISYDPSSSIFAFDEASAIFTRNKRSP